MLQLVSQPATPRHRDGLRGAGARRRARAPGQVHHQPRHRPARLQDAPAHRRGGHQGAARRPSRLHAGAGHPAAARGGGEGPQPPPRRRGRPRHDRHHAGRQAHHVLLDPDVRPAGRRDHVSRSRLSHLPLDDPVHRRQAGADRAAGGERVRLHRRPGAVADHAQDQPDHPQQPQQSLRRRGAGRGGEASRRRPGAASQRRRDVGRDLQPDALRRPQARELPALPRDSATG